MNPSLKSNYSIVLLITTIGILSFCSTQENITHVKNTDTIYANTGGQGISLILEYEKGSSNNHPSFAIWMESMQEDYIQTLFVTKSVGTGIFGHQPVSATEWKRTPGVVKRPSSLPYWLYKRRVPGKDSTLLPTPENPVPDSYTGATPAGSFVLKAHTDSPPDRKFRLLFEINQPWDYNDYWTNDKYPNDSEYRTSCQPSLVYAVTIDLDSPVKIYSLNPVGHGHYSGKDGLLYTDLSTLTTALQIVKSVKVQVF